MYAARSVSSFLASAGACQHQSIVASGVVRGGGPSPWAACEHRTFARACLRMCSLPYEPDAIMMVKARSRRLSSACL